MRMLKCLTGASHVSTLISLGTSIPPLKNCGNICCGWLPQRELCVHLRIVWTTRNTISGTPVMKLNAFASTRTLGASKTDYGAGENRRRPAGSGDTNHYEHRSGIERERMPAIPVAHEAGGNSSTLRQPRHRLIFKIVRSKPSSSSSSLGTKANGDDDCWTRRGWQDRDGLSPPS